GVPKNRHSRDRRGNLLEQLRPFPGQCIVKSNKASCVATRSGQAVDVAAANWINDTVEYNRHRGRHSHQHFQPELTRYHDDVRWKRDQFFRASPSLRGITARPSDFKPHIAAVNPIQLMQDFLEYRDTGLLICLACRTHEHADPPHLLALLRTRRERPCRRCAAHERNDLAPPHSITSSASNRIEFGTSMPRALAVCRLMRNSNLVDCRTGRSAGFAPLRIWTV